MATAMTTTAMTAATTATTAKTDDGGGGDDEEGDSDYDTDGLSYIIIDSRVCSKRSERS